MFDPWATGPLLLRQIVALFEELRHNRATLVSKPRHALALCQPPTHCFKAFEQPLLA
ncbi:hypothetical protein CBM2634_U120004 [Cupriavidus taiwanensis]|uniref:Uncharacterized protein n=1 Tax=Cupriavidus taiwanensis TaxID=164546 RepID=A0A375JD47_9BURK|nr:hypothetical protein CBM2634_U120004 [Cupriavidus taiwanensis]